ncbi:MAG: hypothetical protein AUJ07_04260 [Crenarchaeota archaeon 13_1_40CM_3_53_5]|nr:MAG: hypothetical protein AUJ07_04260 [Crenarchaeota archaeon 13_1_40CM_3_53_5]
MSLLVDTLLSIQALLVFLLAGYEYLTLMNFPRLPASSTPTILPLVSIILPAKDQAKTIDQCVNSLVHLDYPNKEVIVVQGRSTDETQNLLNKYKYKTALIEEDPLPEGWVGKNWACHQGYKQAKGELLLFTDGDSVHSHDSLTRTVSYLQTTQADMVTIAPGTILNTFWEKLLQPPIFLLIMLCVGGKLVNRDNRQNALGNGQYMLFRRAAYEKLGGHYAVRERIVEDYSLARLLKKAGMKLRMVAAPDAVGVRMYSSLGEIWRGWRKNFYTVPENHRFERALFRLTWMLGILVLPYAILVNGIFLAPTTPLNPYLFAGVFMALLLWLGILVLDRSIGVSTGYALLFPVAILVYTAIGVDSTIRGALGLGFTWKGRVYGRPAPAKLEARIA